MSEERDIIIYSTSVCPRCHALKAWCDDSEIQYESRNLEEDPDKLKEFKDAGYKSLPIVEKGGRIHSGARGAKEFITE